MIMNANQPANFTNRNAVISGVAALFTLLSFCIAVAPIPLTGWVCYPTAGLTGLVAFATGLTSLRQIRSSGENGRNFAMLGAWIGGLATLGSLCAVIISILWLPVIANFIRQLSK
jgi:hypothetical protein